MKDQTEQTGATARDEDNALLLQGELADGLQACIGLKEPIAEDWARQLTEYLRRRLGAQSVYIPKPSRADRDAAIFREYNGTNAAEVCERHGVGRTRMHEICNQQRELLRQRAAQQGSPLSSLKTGLAAG
jgi:Mor family transcriptional regulator